MKISILMPIYRCPPDLLGKSLMSVINQNFSDWEILIKDGDFDNPAIRDSRIFHIVDSFPHKIRYFTSPESADRANHQNSYYEALNFCIQHSTGEILTALAGDDERGEPNVLQHINTVFQALGSDPFCVYGACEWMDRNNNRICVKKPPFGISFDTILTDFPFYTPAIFWNRAVHDKFGLFDTNYPWSADLDFWLKVWRGIDSQFTPEVIGKYRQWETSQQRIHCVEAGREATAVADKWRLTR